MGEDCELSLAGSASQATVPFQYSIRQREAAFRTLSIPHPAGQLAIVDFYRKNADMMIFNTGRGSFSLRRPARPARYSVIRDWLFEEQKRTASGVEIENTDQEWIRSYFTYDRYSNVYKFYDSAEYRFYEQKFGYLLKADVTKCFDSIYTHTVAWAAHGHGVVKDNVGRRTKKRSNIQGSFGDQFDTLMQRINHNETSGILIGSELSRIFAETILQAIDRDILHELDSDGLKSGVDYQILRYVDDYFIFLADASNQHHILEVLASGLRRYKLHLNPSKQEGEHTPWLSPLTIAKSEASRLVRKAAKRGAPDLDDDPTRLTRPKVNASKLVLKYKSTLLDTGVSHFDLANFSLAKVERLAEKIMRSSMNEVSSRPLVATEEKHAHAESTVAALVSLLEFVFFAYSGAPRMTPAVKVARIVSSIMKYAALDYIPTHCREEVATRVRSAVLNQLRRSIRVESPSSTTATLLDCLSDLEPDLRLSEGDLIDVLGFHDIDETLRTPKGMNVLLLFSIYLHIRDSIGFERVRSACEAWMIGVSLRPMRDAERSIMILNMVSCPFLEPAFAASLLRDYTSTPAQAASAIRSGATYANVDWRGFDLYSALQRKRLYEVY
ncbi:RNA-directed DNA polymerase [Plantibacter sp. CFBP 8798]|nr:RNA-directed DNA polymerase [Plantibacter sp. CFBP 8798]